MAENSRLARRRSDGALRRLDPFEVLNTLRDEIDRFWRDPLRIGPLAFPFGSVTTSAADFMPRVDVYEQDNTVVVTAELPGLTKDDVQVELDDDGLVIRGKTQAQREVKEDAYDRAERSLRILISRPRRNGHKSPRAACNGVREDRVPPLLTRLLLRVEKDRAHNACGRGGISSGRRVVKDVFGLNL